MQTIHLNHLRKVGLKITNDAHANLCFKNEFPHLGKKKRRLYH